MRRSIQLAIAVLFGIAATHTDAFARGFGAFHGGGGYGGFHGGGFDAGGFHGGGFDAGGFHPGGVETGGVRTGGYDAGGFRSGGYDPGAFRSGGYNAGGFRSGYNTGGFRASQYGGGMFGGGGWQNAPSRGELSSFLGLPTDGGMGMIGGAAGGRGIAAGPGGVAAGKGVVGGTAVEGPRGNVYTHSTAAGRGVAVGAGGAAAARRGYAGAYGTRYFSPTYCRAQGLAAQRWCAGRGVFTPAWSVAHPWAWRPGGYTAAAWAAAAWRFATWPVVGTWLAWDATPAYYDYGDNVTYQNNYVYYGSQPIETAQQYYQQAGNLADVGGGAQPAGDAQWLPLGVFGLMAEGQATPEMVFQLAVDKTGRIGGNYYDRASDAIVPVSGAVDKKDQRAAWRVGANKDMVIETGLYNLTQDQSTALVHFGSDRTQQYVLVRLKQPDEQQQQPASPPAG